MYEFVSSPVPPFTLPTSVIAVPLNVTPLTTPCVAELFRLPVATDTSSIRLLPLPGVCANVRLVDPVASGLLPLVVVPLTDIVDADPLASTDVCDVTVSTGLSLPGATRSIEPVVSPSPPSVSK
jgi:hypothetical protein